MFEQRPEKTDSDLPDGSKPDATSPAPHAPMQPKPADGDAIAEAGDNLGGPA